jgi:hypothetical protein
MWKGDNRGIWEVCQKQEMFNEISSLRRDLQLNGYYQASVDKKQTPWFYFASELYRLSDCRLSAKSVPTLADRGYRVVSATNPYGCNFRSSFR